jgi:hypothetical protein
MSAVTSTPCFRAASRRERRRGASPRREDETLGIEHLLARDRCHLAHRHDALAGDAQAPPPRRRPGAVDQARVDDPERRRGLAGPFRRSEEGWSEEHEKERNGPIREAHGAVNATMAIGGAHGEDRT